MWHVTFYKHLVYVVFVSFIRQSRHCYLKDSWEFLHSLDLGKNNPWIGYTFQRVIRFSLRKRFTTILRGDSKHIQNRFCFSKTKDFMFQRLISKHMQTPASKCSIPRIPVCVYVCVSVCVCLCMMGKGGGAGKGIHLLMFHEVVWDIKKSSSAAVFHHVLVLPSCRLVRPAADDDIFICCVAPLGNYKTKNQDQWKFHMIFA